MGQRRAANVSARRLRAREVEKARTLQRRLRRAAAGRARTRRGRSSQADLDAADVRDVAVGCESVGKITRNARFSTSVHFDARLQQGKKITSRDGIAALWAPVKYRFMDW